MESTIPKQYVTGVDVENFNDEKGTIMLKSVNGCSSIKERHKCLTQDMLRLWYYVETMDKQGLDHGAKCLQRLRKNTDNTKILVHMSKAEYARASGDIHRADCYLGKVEQLLRIPETSNSLKVWYMLTKGLISLHMGRAADQKNVYAEAVQLSLTQGAYDATTRGMMALACYHSSPGRDKHGEIIIPSADSMFIAETSQGKVCEQRLAILEDLDCDSDILHKSAERFVITSLIRYLYNVLRSCPAANGFRCFEMFHFPFDNLHKAEQCIEKIKSMEYRLTEWDAINLFLGQCDYHLRRASFEAENNSVIGIYENAKCFIDKAIVLITKGAGLFTIDSRAIEIREHFIGHKIHQVSKKCFSSQLTTFDATQTFCKTVETSRSSGSYTAAAEQIDMENFHCESTSKMNEISTQTLCKTLETSRSSGVYTAAAEQIEMDLREDDSLQTVPKVDTHHE